MEYSLSRPRELIFSLVEFFLWCGEWGVRMLKGTPKKQKKNGGKGIIHTCFQSSGRTNVVFITAITIIGIATAVITTTIIITTIIIITTTIAILTPTPLFFFFLFFFFFLRLLLLPFLLLLWTLRLRHRTRFRQPPHDRFRAVDGWLWGNQG